MRQRPVMDWVAQDLQRLADEDKIERSPTDAEWRAIVAAARQWAEDYDPGTTTEVDEFVYDHAPDLLCEWWRDVLRGNRAAEKRMWADINEERDRANKMGKYAPKFTITIEKDLRPGHIGDATEKQKEYLRALGVRDQEAILQRITKKNASEMIYRVLQARAKLGLPEH